MEGKKRYELKFRPFLNFNAGILLGYFSNFDF